MSRLLPAVALAAVILPGIVQGVWTNRWGESDQLRDFVARLDAVPEQFREWQGQDLAINPRALAESGLSGFLSRRYRHRVSKNEVFVLVAAGRPGPVSVHTPQVCYEGLGYNITPDGIKASLHASESGIGGDFKNGIFMKSSPGATDYLKIYWSWNASGRWQTPSQPRVSFAGHSGLYKLYVICPFARAEQQEEVDRICQSFLDDFLPELHKALF